MKHQSTENIHPGNIDKQAIKHDIAGAKVLLINMPIREHVLPNNPPLGPLQIAAVLKENNADVQVLDLNSYRKDGLFLNELQTEKIVADMLYG